jgi:hypothetical protein
MSSYNLNQSSSNSKKKYIDLTVNGKLFPSWILKNFKYYHLPEIIKTAGVDLCNTPGSKLSSAKIELRKYQKFVGEYLDFQSPYKNIL